MRRFEDDGDVFIIKVIDSPCKVKKRPRSFFPDNVRQQPTFAKKKCVVDLTEAPLPPVIDLTDFPKRTFALEQRRKHSSDLDLTPELPSSKRSSSSNSSSSSQRSLRKTLFPSLSSGEKTPPLEARLPSYYDQLPIQAPQDTNIPGGAGVSYPSDGASVKRRLANESDTEDSNGVKSSVAPGSVGGEAAMAAGRAVEMEQDLEDVKPKVDSSLLSLLEKSGSNDHSVGGDSEQPKKDVSTHVKKDTGDSKQNLNISLLTALNEWCSKDLSPPEPGSNSPSLKQLPHPVSEESQSHPLLSDVFQPGWKGTPIQEVRIVMAERGLSCVKVRFKV